jgi:hypothetical protein
MATTIKAQTVGLGIPWERGAVMSCLRVVMAIELGNGI